MIIDKNIDEGRPFDWGKTSKEYAKYRDIYPKQLFDELIKLGVGKKGSDWLDLGTGTGVLPRQLAYLGANIIATDISEEQIEEAKILSKNYKNISYSVSSAEDIEYPSGTFDVITACQCFFYFDPDIIVPKIKKMLKKDGIFVKIWMSYLKEDELARKSFGLVKKINSEYHGGGAAIKDLKTHYFANPCENILRVDIPFTRESWHGRMMASRGVMASMNEKQVKQYEKEHLEMLKEYPEEFTVGHVVFITSYRM
ncbi:MAG: class I SAM-dependent methyltransferase [Agathobacter sp.]|nr:class I SAM-dependent methyltransferase [Agathobacter sp.]